MTDILQAPGARAKETGLAATGMGWPGSRGYQRPRRPLRRSGKEGPSMSWGAGHGDPHAQVTRDPDRPRPQATRVAPTASHLAGRGRGRRVRRGVLGCAGPGPAQRDQRGGRARLRVRGPRQPQPGRAGLRRSDRGAPPALEPAARHRPRVPGPGAGRAGRRGRRVRLVAVQLGRGWAGPLAVPGHRAGRTGGGRLVVMAAAAAARPAPGQRRPVPAGAVAAARARRGGRRDVASVHLADRAARRRPRRRGGRLLPGHLGLAREHRLAHGPPGPGPDGRDPRRLRGAGRLLLGR